MRRALTVLIASVLISACMQQGGPKPSFKRASLEGPGQAQPSHIVAREIAMLQRSGEIGQLRASAEFACRRCAGLVPRGCASRNRIELHG